MTLFDVAATVTVVMLALCVLAVATVPLFPTIKDGALTDGPVRCPDCGAPGVAVADRCGYLPARGAVHGHGHTPKSPPLPARTKP